MYKKGDSNPILHIHTYDTFICDIKNIHFDATKNIVSKFGNHTCGNEWLRAK